MSNNQLTLRVTGIGGAALPNLARFAHYIGVVSQINGSLINEVTITDKMSGPETTSPDGKHLSLGVKHLPDMSTAKPTAIAAWCGTALHGFAHSRYSPRTTEPLRATLQKKGLHRTWNMIEDARIERLLLREFPGWTPHLMGACNWILFGGNRTVTNQYGVPVPKPKPNLSGVYPLIVGRTYLPADLRAEAYEAFAEENSEFIADGVRDLVMRYLTLVDPGSEDHDETVEIVTRLKALLGGDFGSDCGSHDVDDSNERQWTDPGDPDEDDEEDIDPDADPDDDESDDESDDDGDTGDGDGEQGGDEESDDDDGNAGATDDEEGGESDDGGDSGGQADDGDDGDDEGDAEGSDGEGGGVDAATSRLADWANAIDQALEEDERLADAAEAVSTGPLPTIQLPMRDVSESDVPNELVMTEQDIARELRVLMDGARPGMRRRIDRGRFNVARVVREGGTTRAEEMFDRHDPGALRSTGCAVAVLADVSGSMDHSGALGAMRSVWAIDRAVQSVRGKFKAWTFGYNSQELPPSEAGHVWMPTRLDGNTQPLLGLSAAQAWLSQQREPNKLCIVATDGAWDADVQCREVLSSMAHAGMQVAVFGIDTPNIHDRFRLDAHITTAFIRQAADLGPAVGEMLVNRVRSSLHR